jgi:hypothetical protein
LSKIISKQSRFYLTLCHLDYQSDFIIQKYHVQLESEFGKEVKQGAVVMALKRLTEELDFRLNHKINKVIKISVKSPFARLD